MVTKSIMDELPAGFTRNIRNSFGPAGEQFLADLPALINAAARRWHLAIGRPFLLSYNYVCEARDERGQEVVLKIGVPNPELTSEIEALRLYDGQGAARLLDADAEKGLLLEERLRPGSMLADLEDDEQATRIAAGGMRALWRPVPEQNHLIRLQDWFKGYPELRRSFDGGTGPFPQRIVATAEDLVRDFFAEDEPPVVLHGDFHHYNLLRSGETWRVIDPKGVIGPRGYEVGPFLINPWPGLLQNGDAKRKTVRRIAILSEQLGMERERIRGWALAHAVLSAWWSCDEQGRGGEYAIRCAELFMSLGK